MSNTEHPFTIGSRVWFPCNRDPRFTDASGTIVYVASPGRYAVESDSDKTVAVYLSRELRSVYAS